MEDLYQLYIDRLNVQDILYYAGYRQNRRDGLRYPSYSRIDDEGRRVKGDKFICMPGGKTCFQPPVIKSYNVISLIESFPEMFPEYSQGKHGYELVHAVCRQILNMPQEHRPERMLEPAKDQKPFDIRDYKVQHFQKYNVDSYRAFMPFLQERGLNCDTLKAFGRNLLVTEKRRKESGSKRHTHLSFPLTVPGKVGTVGLEERGRARLDGTSGYKGKALGSNAREGLWIACLGDKDLSKSCHVYWFESGYDAMAYYQLHAGQEPSLGRSVFLSTGGTPTLMQFRGVIQQAQNAVHHLCFDNDLAGRQYATNFQDELRRMRESIPKVPEDMKEFVQSMKQPGNYLSGTPEFLPDDLYKAYGEYFDATDEFLSMKQSRLCHPDDIKEQQAKAIELHRTFVDRVNEKLSIGKEQAPLKSLGTYDVPEWALCAIENGDHEGLDEEEESALIEFEETHFPDGFVADIDLDDPNEFNLYPAFGARNPDALTRYGESPYQAVKTYPVHFYHPTEREAYALPDLKVVRELPEEGCKDFNEQVMKELMEENSQQQKEDERESESAGVDINADGEIEVCESEEKKHTHSMGR